MGILQYTTTLMNLYSVVLREEGPVLHGAVSGKCVTVTFTDSKGRKKDS